MDYNKIGRDIIKGVGGKENINDLTHCFTRLRFELKDKDKADSALLNQVEGVISTVYSSGQYQVVIGSKVEKVFNAVQEALDDLKTEDVQKSVLDRTLILITQIFTPIVPAIAASGLIKGLLTAANMLLSIYFSIDISTSDTYILLFAASQIIFYFMPIFLAYTTAKALKTDKFTAMLLGGFLVYPQINEMMLDYQTQTSIFGLPFIKGAWGTGDNVRVFSYVESVIPIILTVIALYFLEKGLKKVTPEILQIILVPGLSVIIMLPIMLSVTGPIGIYLGNMIQTAYNAIIDFSPTLGGAMVGGLWGVFVIFGAHRALLPVGLNDVALTGRQNLLAFAGAANFAQGGAVLGVALKTKNKDLESISYSAFISAILVGITEPAIYGANLRLKKPMISAVISGALGGAIMGYGNVYGDAFANNGILTIFTYAAFGLNPFIYYLVGCLVAFVGATALTYVIGFEDIPVSNSSSNSSTDEKTTTEKLNQVNIVAPVEGVIVPINTVNDPTFANNLLGEGIAISPSEGIVLAPASGEVVAVFPTNHAFGLKLDDGIELLIHIGINTVELNGQHFQSHVKVGDYVEQYQLLANFNIKAIEEAGYDTTVFTIITNNEEFKLHGIQSNQTITNQDSVFTLEGGSNVSK